MLQARLVRHNLRRCILHAPPSRGRRAELVVPLRRHFCDAEQPSEVEQPKGPRVLFRAKPLKAEAQVAQGAILHGAIGMAGGMGMAFLGIAPLTNPNVFMFGLLLATVQVHLGYNLLLRNLWQQRRRWVTELTEREDGTVVVTHDGGVERRLTLQQSDGPSMADLAEKAKTWFWVDREAGEVLDSEALDALLKSDLSIAKENLVVTPVMGETVEQSRQIVEPFAKLTKEQLSKIADQDDGGSPKKQLQQLERISQLSGLGFMAMGLLAYVFGNRSAESYIRTVAQNYKPPDPSRPPPAPMGRGAPPAPSGREAAA
ncbi:unnamed protein product [Effrenium voratum]|nr:unnamed protein product [Effrenium voratum]